MKKTILNIVTYGLLGWGAFSAVYLALPIEIQAMLPDMNWVTAVISGGSTTILGSVSLYIQTLVNRAKVVNNEILANVTEMVTSSQVEYKNIVESNLSIVDAINLLTKATDRNNLLLSVDLKTKLSNPLIDATAKALIEGVLYGDQQE